MSFSSAVRWEVGEMLSEVISLSAIAGTFLICPFSFGFQWVKNLCPPPHLPVNVTSVTSMLNCHLFSTFHALFFSPSSVSCRFSCHSLYSSSLCSFLILSSWVQGNSVHFGCFEPTYEWGCPHKEGVVFFFFNDCWRSHLCLNICDFCPVFNWSSSYNAVKSFC